jgi:predicted nucleotidyltransferase
MIDKLDIIKTFGLQEPNVLTIFPYGSQVYKTANEQSDHDFIVIFKDGTVEDEFAITRDKLSIHSYNDSSFQDLLNRHKISAMECYFLPTESLLLERKKFKFDLHIDKLRSAISEKSSHSWVKAKKKFEVEKDRNVYIAKKSLFHSLRIIDFGKQIAVSKKITDYTCSNYYWEEIYTNPSERWESYKEQYQGIYNSKMSDFRKLAPK